MRKNLNYNKHKQCPILNVNGTKTNNQQETMSRWAEYIKQNFYVGEKGKEPEIQYIPEKTWKVNTTKITNNWEQQIQPGLKIIRQNSKLTKIMETHKHIQYWLASDYTEKEVKTTIKKLKNRKAHGSDGIPAEAYKTLAPWITRQITNLMNLLKNGAQLPEEWVEGAIVTYIQKQRKPRRLQLLQTHMSNANNIQNMVTVDYAKAIRNTTHPDK